MPLGRVRHHTSSLASRFVHLDDSRTERSDARARRSPGLAILAIQRRGFCHTRIQYTTNPIISYAREVAPDTDRGRARRSADKGALT